MCRVGDRGANISALCEVRVDQLGYLNVDMHCLGSDAGVVLDLSVRENH